jgi:MFS family permease
MGIFGKAVSTYKRYPPQYWVVISLELFERGAYYGIMGYYPVHLVSNLGFSGTMVGILYALLVFLLYFVPIVASALARKYGYKTILTIAFILIIPTYISMTFLKSPIAFFPAVIAWGIGAGAFKPMVSATIAHVTEKEERNSAYSIYYLSINWGSLLAMVSIGFLIPQHFAQIVFLVGAVLITINLLITIFLYKSPVEKNPQEKISEAFIKMGKVLSDRKFTILLTLYAGFFFIFSAMHTFLPIYYIEFGIKPWSWFNAPLMTAINPLTIVMLGPFLSKFMDRFQSLKLMIVGMFTFSFGLLLLGTIPIWQAMAIGIVIFSVGEFLTHPSFISYVSKIAPEDKVALYMGYAFLPSAAGSVIGSLFGGVMWDTVAVDMEMPKLFWCIYVGIGLFSIGNFLIYNKFFGPKSEKAVKVKKDFFTFRWSFLGVWAVIPILVLAGISLGSTPYIGSQNVVVTSEWENMTRTISLTETLQNGETFTVEEYINETNVYSITATLTWIDESDSSGIIPLRRLENLPDTFSMTYEPTNHTTETDRASNSHGSAQTISLSSEYQIDRKQNIDYLNGTGYHTFIITLEETGDQVPVIGPGIIAGEADNSNEFSMQITILYLKRTEIKTEIPSSAGH